MRLQTGIAAVKSCGNHVGDGGLVPGIMAITTRCRWGVLPLFFGVPWVSVHQGGLYVWSRVSTEFRAHSRLTRCTECVNCFLLHAVCGMQSAQRLHVPASAPEVALRAARPADRGSPEDCLGIAAIGAGVVLLGPAEHRVAIWVTREPCNAAQLGGGY